MPKVIETSAITEVIDVAMELGEKIREARRGRGWSQADLARESGVSQPAILKIEKSMTRQSKFLPAVLQALDLPLSLLTEGRAEAVELPDPERSRRLAEANRMLEKISPERFDRILATISDAVAAETGLKPEAGRRRKAAKRPE